MEVVCTAAVICQALLKPHPSKFMQIKYGQLQIWAVRRSRCTLVGVVALSVKTPFQRHSSGFARLKIIQQSQVGFKFDEMIHVFLPSFSFPKPRSMLNPACTSEHCSSVNNLTSAALTATVIV